MNIVLGLTDEDIKTIFLIRATVCNLYDEKDFPDDPTEMQQKRYDDWKMMSDVISKIGFVIENQMEIDKATTGNTHESDCQSKRCNDKDAFLREKLITILEEVGVPKNIMIDTGQNYAAVTDGEMMTADNKCSGTAGSLERHLSSIKQQEINDRNNIYHSGKSSG